MSRPQKQNTELDQAKTNKARRPQPEQTDPLAEWGAPDAEVVQHALAHPAQAQPAALMALQGTAGNQAVQRLVLQCQDEEEDEAPIQAMPAIQRQGSGDGFRLDDETAGRISRARGGGQPLDHSLQAQMGARLGYDFSGVRVHTGPESDELNQQLSARAFTTGGDIFFRQGEYNPGSGGGRELIAHELTHVVQQGTGRVTGDGGMTVRPRDDREEHEARHWENKGGLFTHQPNPSIGSSEGVRLWAPTSRQNYAPPTSEQSRTRLLSSLHRSPKNNGERSPLLKRCNGSVTGPQHVRGDDALRERKARRRDEANGQSIEGLYNGEGRNRATEQHQSAARFTPTTNSASSHNDDASEVSQQSNTNNSISANLKILHYGIKERIKSTGARVIQRSWTITGKGQTSANDQAITKDDVKVAVSQVKDRLKVSPQQIYIFTGVHGISNGDIGEPETLFHYEDIKEQAVNPQHVIDLALARGAYQGNQPNEGVIRRFIGNTITAQTHGILAWCYSKQWKDK